MAPTPQAPQHLTPASRKLWRDVIADYRLADDGTALATLKLALEALDRAEEARQVVARDGAYVLDRFNQTKPHPALAVERDSRTSALRALRELNLQSATEPNQPPRLGPPVAFNGGR